MADEKKTSEQDDTRKKPESNANSQPMPEEYSNTANHKGAVDLGTEGTKATASQQQGQGAWNAKDKDNRSGSGDGGKSGKDKSGNQD